MSQRQRARGRGEVGTMLRKVECLLLKCDGCGYDFDSGDFTPHYSKAADAEHRLVDMGGSVSGDQHFCEDCTTTRRTG